MCLLVVRVGSGQERSAVVDWMAEKGVLSGSYSVGLLGALAYIRMLSNSVEAIGSSSVASAAL